MPTFRDINQFNTVSDSEVNPEWSLQVSATQRVTLGQIAKLCGPLTRVLYSELDGWASEFLKNWRGSKDNTYIPTHKLMGLRLLKFLKPKSESTLYYDFGKVNEDVLAKVATEGTWEGSISNTFQYVTPYMSEANYVSSFEAGEMIDMLGIITLDPNGVNIFLKLSLEVYFDNFLYDLHGQNGTSSSEYWDPLEFEFNIQYSLNLWEENSPFGKLLSLYHFFSEDNQKGYQGSESIIGSYLGVRGLGVREIKHFPEANLSIIISWGISYHFDPAGTDYYYEEPLKIILVPYMGGSYNNRLPKPNDYSFFSIDDLEFNLHIPCFGFSTIPEYLKAVGIEPPTSGEELNALPQ